MTTPSDWERRRVERRGNERRSEGRMTAALRPSEQRRHARYDRNLAVRIFKRGQRTDAVVFSAGVSTQDISVGGLFVASTFFLKKGFELDLEMDLPELGRTVRAAGVVARIVDKGSGGATSSGFAIRFTEFHEDSEIYLRAYLTRGDIFAFVDEFASELLPELASAKRPKLVELIVRWEIFQEQLER